MNVSLRALGAGAIVVARLAIILVLLASATIVTPSMTDAGGRARISASYSLSGGTIRVQGSHFRPNARVLVTIVDVSQGPGAEVTRETQVRANKRGAFNLSSPGWCPRVVEVTATDISRGTTARDTLENSDCPW